jgi:hypothetical protein
LEEFVQILKGVLQFASSHTVAESRSQVLAAQLGRSRILQIRLGRDADVEAVNGVGFIGELPDSQGYLQGKQEEKGIQT